jgi:PAS domain S-box-containing protein
VDVRKILIASDDPRAATELAARVTSLGYASPSLAHTAEGMLAAASALRPDLVVIGVGLDAGRSARQLAADVRRIHPASIVFTTDDDSDAALERAGLGDRDCVLAAPFTDRELRVTLELALCRHDQAQNTVDLENRFFAVSIDMLCQLDFNGYFKRLNPAWERTLGFTVEELRSRPFIEFVHPDDRERTLQQNRIVRDGGSALGFENRYLCRDGSYRWFLWNAASDAGERVIYSVARDITARKEADDERERLLGELQTALAEVKVLREILPICSYCKKIRDDENFWLSVESYISRHTNTRFSHGICPECMTLHVEPQIAQVE